MQNFANFKHKNKKLLAILVLATMIGVLCACAPHNLPEETINTTEPSGFEETQAATEEMTEIEEIAQTDAAEVESIETEEFEDDPDATESNEDDNNLTQPPEDQEEAVRETEANVTSTYNSSNSSNTSNGVPNAGNSDDYVGRFTIDSVGVDVGCYANSSQATVDAGDSAAYFHLSGHNVVGDHVNQGFDGIKNCKEGTIAKLETSSGTREYECVDKIIGYNKGGTLTDANGNSIADMYPGALVCYTCNDKTDEVTIVFFKTSGSDKNEIPEELNGKNNEYYPNRDTKTPCDAGSHRWEFVDSFIYRDGSVYRYQRFLKEHFVCSACGSDWLKETLLETVVVEEEAQTGESSEETADTTKDDSVANGEDGGEVDMGT